MGCHWSRLTENKGPSAEEFPPSQRYIPVTRAQPSGTIAPDQGNAPNCRRTLTVQLPLERHSATARQDDTGRSSGDDRPTDDDAVQAQQNTAQPSSRLRNHRPTPNPSPRDSDGEGGEGGDEVENTDSTEETISSQWSEWSDATSIDPYGTIHTTGPEPFTANLGSSDPFAHLNAGRPYLKPRRPREPRSEW